LLLRHDGGVEPLGVRHGQVLDSVTMVGDQPGQVPAVALPDSGGLIDGVDDVGSSSWSPPPTSPGAIVRGRRRRTAV